MCSDEFASNFNKPEQVRICRRIAATVINRNAAVRCVCCCCRRCVVVVCSVLGEESARRSANGSHEGADFVRCAAALVALMLSSFMFTSIFETAAGQNARRRSREKEQSQIREQTEMACDSFVSSVV